MARQLLRWRRRAALPATLMRPCPVAGRHVLAEHAGQLPLAADEHVVEARATRAPEEPCAHGMRLWRARRGPQDRDATGRRDAGARRPARAIVVADQGARALAEGGGLAPLLGDPGVGRLARRAQVDDAPRGQFDDEAGAQRPEEAVGDREEVARPAVGDVVAQERRPRLPARARRAVAAQLGLARALRHADAQLAQCAAAPRGTPARVLGRQPPDQGDGLRREGRSGPGCDRRRQRARNQARCRRSRVSGWMRSRAARQARTRPARSTRSARSACLTSGRLTLRRSTSSRWRRRACSASSCARPRTRSAPIPVACGSDCGLAQRRAPSA